jgi:hypothetical protein
MCVVTAVGAMGESVPVTTRPPPRSMAASCATCRARFSRATVWSVFFAAATNAWSAAYSQVG